MDWQPIAPGVWESEGYRIAAFRVAGAWVYGLFAPPLTEKEHESLLKIRYERGESVPQRRPLLGHYPRPELARAAADEHKSIGKTHDPFPIIPS